MIQVRENLHGTRTSTPRIEAVVLHEQVRPDLQIEWDAEVIAATSTARLDGRSTAARPASSARP
jgi:hypothetical protein